MTFDHPPTASPLLWSAPISLILALLGIASGSILFVLAGKTMSPQAIAFNRLWIAASLFAVWNGWEWLRRDRSASTTQPEDPISRFPSWQEWLWLGAAGSSFAGFLVLLAWALTQTTVANAALLTHMMPMFTTLGAWLVWGKRFSARFLLGLGVAVAGAVALGLEDWLLAEHGDGLSASSVLGDGAALGAAALLAIELLIVEQLRRRLATPIITMGECAIGSLVVLPTAIWSGGGVLPATGQGIACVLGLALITQMMGHGLLTYSLSYFSASLAAIALLATPMIAALMALLLFGQTITWVSSIAFGVVLVGIYMAVSEPKISPVSPSPNPSANDSGAGAG
jgi:drug/metabolite transporter (DMT)-like permease